MLRRCAMTTTHEGPTSPSITWGYRRKSSLQQSYERQTKALHDLGIPEERIFEDAMSGRTMNRPGWLSLLSHVRANDEVWVDGLDRLGRSTLATLQAMEELELRGVRVRSAKPGEDLQGTTGELIRQIMLVMAQWERRQMLERVAEARAARLAAGKPAGRPKTALADKQVRHIHALHAAGYSVKQIVGDLGISRASVYRALALRPAPADAATEAT
ncbi:recombinase family protein [Amnibacterium endophyticum]|uniref:Recombinase family protein n=1 Tax=Amnibacterium endophyticum TaxID=2109337 RepID=A0ABW4LG22_9MICO